MHLVLVYTAYILTSVGWGIAYISIIYRGWKDQTYGMPLVALAANISWEFFLSFIIPTPTILKFRNILWFGLDLIIVYQCLRYAQQEFRYPVLKRHASLIVLGTIFAAGALVGTIMWKVQDLRGWYSGLMMNVSMSILFVMMFLDRNNIRGQSLYAALFKFLGTFGAILAVIVASPANVLSGFTGMLPEQWYPPSTFMLAAYAIIAVFDWIYIIAIYRAIAERGINPWRRL